MKNLKYYFLIIVCMICCLSESKGSHLSAADIYYEHIQDNTWKIILKVYRDCSGSSLNQFNQVVVSSQSCSYSLPVVLTRDSIREVSQLCPSEMFNSSCHSISTYAIPGLEEHTYSLIYEFPFKCPDWKIYFKSCTRNNAITNIYDPDLECLYIEATLDNVHYAGNNSPQFTNLPVLYACQGSLIHYNHGGIDPDGDSLVFSLASCLSAENTPVQYIPPSTATYPVLDTRGFNTFNSSNGDLTFSPSSSQVSVMSVKIDEFRNGIRIGSIIRDLQVIIRSCNNIQPTSSSGITNYSNGNLLNSSTLQICKNSPVTFQISCNDPNAGNILSVSSNIQQILPGAGFSVSGTNPATATIVLPGINRSGLIPFTLTVKDNGCPVTNQQIFTYNLKLEPPTGISDDHYTYCPGGIDPVLQTTGGSNFSWQVLSGDPIIVGDNFSCNPCQAPVAQPDTTTTYIVTSDLPNSCNNKDTVTVYTSSGFTTDAFASSNKACIGDTISLHSMVTSSDSTSTSYSYTWEPSEAIPACCWDSASAQAVVLQPAGFTSIIVNDSTKCKVSKTFFVDTASALPNLLILPDSAIICEGSDSISITALVYETNNYTQGCDVYDLKEIPYAPATGSVAWSTSWLSYQSNQKESNINIGFDFSYFCNSYNTITTSTEGWIGFGNYTSTYPNSGIIPHSSKPNNIIAAGWDNLNPGFNGTIRYATVGTSPNRTFIVQFNNIARAYGGGFITSEIHLIEQDMSIEIHIGSISNGSQFSHTVGIENADGSKGLSPFYHNNQTGNTSNTAYRFELHQPQAITNGLTFNWTPDSGINSSNQNSILAFPDSNTTYYLSVSDDDGYCNNPMYDSVLVMLSPLPEVSVSASDTLLCTGDKLVLTATTATGSGSFLWNNGTQTPYLITYPFDTKVYTVEGTSSLGCSGLDSIQINVYPQSDVTITNASSLETCYGQTIVLNTSAGAGFTYLWSTGDTSESITVTPTHQENIYLSGLDTNQCSYKSMYSIELSDAPYLKINGAHDICEGETLVLSATSEEPYYYWSAGSGGLTNYYSPDSSGYIYVHSGQFESCHAVDSVYINVYPGPSPVITGDTTSALYGQLITLSTGAYKKYQWNTGETTQTIHPEIYQDSLFWVTVSNDIGCSETAYVKVRFTPELQFPNIITPNTDSVNDQFTIGGLYLGGTLQVFNRWGRLVYQNSEYDHSFNASGLPNGTYYYLYTSKYTKAHSFNGWLKVAR